MTASRTWPYRLGLIASLTLLGGLFQADGALHTDQLLPAIAYALHALLIIAIWEISRWGWRAK